MLSFRDATTDDIDLYFEWANDELVRRNSFDSNAIQYDDHCQWFYSKLQNNKCLFLVFCNDSIPVGQVRIEGRDEQFYIGISVDQKFRSEKYGTSMLIKSGKEFFRRFTMENALFAEIKHENIASVKAFERAGYEKNGEDSMKLTFILHRSDMEK